MITLKMVDQGGPTFVKFFNKFTISNQIALRSYLRLICEYEAKKLVPQKNMVKPI